MTLANCYFFTQKINNSKWTLDLKIKDKPTNQEENMVESLQDLSWC